MSRPDDDETPTTARPVRLPRAAQDLIRSIEPERSPPSPPGPERYFLMDGEAWIARQVGEASVGSSALGAASIVTIRFYRAAEPDRPQREALLPRGRFEMLYDEELRALFHAARRLDVPS